MSALILGIDIGTSGVRTAVIDQEANIISTARAPHASQVSDRIDANKWWDAVKSCLQTQGQALRDVGCDMSDIGHIGIDGTSGTMVLTDTNLRPVTRALMYNSSGFVVEADQIAAKAPPVHITQGANSALARALRLRSEDRDQEAHHILHQADFIAARLCDIGGISDENNTLKLGYDPATGSWPEWFAGLNLRPSLLPKVYPAGAPIDQVTSNIAIELGLPKSAMVHAGTTDSIAAFFAAAPLETGAAVTSLGTTLAIKILTERRIDAPDIGLYSHKVGDVWLAGGASNTGGGVLAHFFTNAELQSLSAGIDPAIESPLDYYPLIKPGERFPINDPNLAPRLTPRPTDDAAFLHGIFESIARIEKQCYASIAAQGGSDLRQLFTAGGGAENDVWCQIRARILGLTPQKAAQSEASVGMARLILQQLTSD